MTATVLITRPPAQAEAFAAALGGSVRCVISPLMKIVPLPIMDTSADTKHVIFTSTNGVAQGQRAGVPYGITAWCVGEKTAKAAINAGFDVQIAGGTSESLVTLIVAERPAGRIVHLRGQHVAGQVVEGLRAADLHCETIVAYDQKPCRPTQAALDVLRGQNPVIAPLFSPRTAKLLTEISDKIAPLHAVSMSKAVDAAFQSVSVAGRTIAKSPTNDAMIEATLAQYVRFSP